LTKRYGGLEAVRGIWFRVSRGEILALLGLNGAGKPNIEFLFLSPNAAYRLRIAMPIARTRSATEVTLYPRDQNPRTAMSSAASRELRVRAERYSVHLASVTGEGADLCPLSPACA
jgi:ABC-type glutathione transport system ATPase component